MSRLGVLEGRFEFGRFLLEPARRLLLEHGVPVIIGSRAFDLLVVLVEDRNRILPKAELIGRVWGSQVEESSLTVAVSALRKALRDKTGGQRFIETVSSRGYRFVAAMRMPGSAADTGVAPPAAELPSIAVLPFANISGDAAQDYFGDGLAEDIIYQLSRNRWLMVIARNSSFTYKGMAASIPTVARELGVRYVLEGSVRKAGARVRVTAQLIDAATNCHLTAVRYDREIADIFAAQDDITDLVISAIRPVLYEADQQQAMRKPPGSVGAWAAYQRGVWHFSRFAEPESEEARAWFQRAISMDPNFAPGHYGLGLVFLHDGSGYIPNTVPDWQRRGEALAQRAVQLDDLDSGAHSVLGLARMVRGDHAGSLEATERALKLNPNDATAHGTHGATLVFNGRSLEGLQSLATSLHLSPRDPRLRVRHAHVALGHYFAGQLEQSAAAALHIRREWPGFATGPRLHAMALAELGRLDEARAALDAALALSPAPFDNLAHARMPWYRPEDHVRAVAALRLAGWIG